MATYFIADLHLDPSRPESTTAFLRFLSGPVAKSERLFILGDLFEAWIGDDDNSSWLLEIKAALASLTGRVDCGFMHGNRDFLIGERFAKETGVRILDEFELIELGGERVLLTHGDLLCTDDVRYMQLRTQLRDAKWQSDFLAKSLGERRRIAQELRKLSQTEMAVKAADIMDVNSETVVATMRRFGVHTLIHGHTHRPGIHRSTLDGEDAVRIVLGDWYGSPSCMIWDEAGPRSQPL